MTTVQSNISTRSSLESTGTLELRNCNHSVAIQLNSFIFEDGTSGFDITPSESFLTNLEGFDLYSNFELFNILSANITEQEAVACISIELAGAINQQCMKSSTLANPFVELCLSMIGSDVINNHANLWCWKEANEKLVLIELPIIAPEGEGQSSSSSSASMDYFLDVLGQDMPRICIVLNVEKENFEISFQNSSKLNNLEKFIDLPATTRETLLGDHLDNIRRQFQQKLLYRKEYVEELGKIACCPEFNAIDFSFVSLLIRLKYKKLFTMFLVNMKILPKFPMVPPVMTIYDLQSSSIILVEQSQLHWWSDDSNYSNHGSNREYDIKRLATKTVVFICDLMNERAFPDRQGGEQDRSNQSSHS